MTRALILMLLFAVASAPARADDLSRLVDRYASWRGGLAFEHLQSIHMKGALDTSGLHGTEDDWISRDGRQRSDTDLGVFKQTQVVTPEQSWEATPSGQVETLAESDKQSLSRDAALQFIDVLRGAAKTALLPSETRDGHSWAVVRVTFGDADTYDMFIDSRSGALDGIRVVQDRRERFEGFGDWRFVDGVRMPFLQTVTTAVPGGDQTLKITAMELNTAIPAERLARPAAARKADFANGASSTGWIDFDFYDGNRIFFPAKVNGHDVVALLDSGATVTAIDKAYAAALGLHAKGDFTAPGAGGIDTMGFVGGVDVEVGNLTLHGVNAATFDLAPVAARIGHPMPFVLGDEVFNELAVDIDFVHHRLAFRDPARLTKPADAVEVPLKRMFGNRSVPVSIEGAPPVEFEFDLGNGSPLEIDPAYYQPHKLLDGRRTSQVLAGAIGGFHPWTVATMDRIEFAGVEFQNVPTEFTPDTISGANSNVVVGNIGLPMLARFRLIIDYSHDRLYATPAADAASVPFRKDRLGLALSQQREGFTVDFVSPGSPAEQAGFKTGDKIALIDGKPVLPGSELTTLRFAPAGTIVTFTMEDGAVRRVGLADFF